MRTYPKQELIQILKTDVKKFNEIRKEQNYKPIDLSGASTYIGTVSPYRGLILHIFEHKYSESEKSLMEG